MPLAPVQLFAIRELGFFAIFFGDLFFAFVDQAFAGFGRGGCCGLGATVEIQLQKARSLKRRRRDSAIKEKLVRQGVGVLRVGAPGDCA